MTLASIVVPAYNVARTLPETLHALMAQTHAELEIIIVNDGSTDATPAIADSFAQQDRSGRVRVIHQANRGLAGARNSGIAAARGEYIGFCDSDDLWVSDKLARHIAHLNARPQVGVSYAGSALMDDHGQMLGTAQKPRLTDIDPVVVFKRNPIGNGSAPVIRRAVLNAIAYRPPHETARDWYFDETFRQSEDIECWLRIALTTDWDFEGIDGLLTHYRISTGGLSAATDRQLAAWDRMVDKLTPLNPAFFAVNTADARAYQLRYLSRRAINDLDAPRTRTLTRAWLATSCAPLIEEPGKSLATLGAALALSIFGGAPVQRAQVLLPRLRQLGCAK